MNFQDNLKRLRKEHNLSQEELAEKLNVTRQAVSKWESAQAYPEMDKIIAICKLFDINIDDLLNNDLKQVKEKQNKTNTLNKYIDSFLSYISKTVNLLSSMTFKSKIKCLLEQVIITIILVIIFLLGDSLLSHIAYKFMYTYGLYTLFDILETLYYTISLIIYIFLITYIFKIRYLDYYTEFYNKEEVNPTPKIDIKKEEEKIIIRDPNHSEYRFINGLVKSLIFFIKIIACFILLTLSFTLLFLVILFTCSFLFISNTSLFISIILILLGIICLNILFITIIYNFIANKKNHDKLVLISGISSLIISGIGTGLFVITLSNIDTKNDFTDKNFISTTYTYSMENDFLLYKPYFVNNDFNYIEKDIPNIEVEVIHSVFNEPSIEQNSENDHIYHLYLYNKNDNDNLLYKEIISNLNHNKLIDYFDYKVNIYANKENLAIIKNNQANN